MNKPVMPNEERRAVKIELRSSGTDATPMILGHAAMFNSLSEPLSVRVGGKSITFREKIMPGAFADALKSSDIRALFNHNPDHILGRSSAGTLRVSEDAAGLAIEIDPPDTTCARDLQVSMQRGDVREMSFGFTTAEDGDEWVRDAGTEEVWTRTITKVSRLYDVSPVTYPAYPETDCALRSLSKAQAVIPDHSWRQTNEMMRRRLDLEAVTAGPELRVNMGWCGENTVGVCQTCNGSDCLCAGCPNMACCNMQTAANGGCCTKCMQPGCLCLTCPNTDQAKLLKMYSM